MGVLHALRIKSPYKLLRIEDIKIDNKPNEHGYLYLKCLIDDSIKFQSAINASASDKICVYEELEDENLRESSVNINVVNENKSKILFNGMISSIKTTNNNGVYYLEIEGITSSFELDIKEKSRSFQNANMTYEELIGTILKDYSGYGYTQCTSKGKKIGKPLFQYKETDWSFLKRIASELNSELFCDIMETRNIFYFGRPVKSSYEIEDSGFYKACKDLKRFHEAGGSEAGHDTDYFYYEIKKREKYDIGDKIRFKNKDFYVNQYSAYALKDEVIYKYRLCRKNGIWQTKMYNSLLSGGSLEGKVLAVEGEKVKLNLDIDKGQSKEAAWFSYAPPTGNTMYSMPVVGTSATLYFPNESSEAPIVTGCVRKNGGSCAKTSDTTKRYFGTEHGSEIEMTPGALNINGGSKEPLNISFDDNTGVTLKSPKKLSLNADGEIIIKTPQNINIKAESQIIVAKAGTQSGFSVENEFHFAADTTIEDATDRKTYPPFDDEPKVAQKPEEKQEKKEEKKQEKKGFSWGKLALAAVAAVAVVASVATFGVGAAIACAVAVACVGVICAAASTSTTNSSSSGGGENDIGARIMNAFKGALSGANPSPIIKSFNSLKEIGCDIWNGFKNRGEKALDSPYDFANWLALGIPGAIKATLQSNYEKSEKAFNSVYDFTNWLSFGAADMVKGAVNPEDPFSKEHWLDSFGVVTTILGVRKAVVSKGKTSMLDDIPRSSKVTKRGTKNKSNLDLEVGSNAETISHPVVEYPRTGSALKNDFYHKFSDIVDNYAKDAQRFDLRNAKGHMDDLYQIEGSIVKYETNFEKIKNNAPKMKQTKEIIDGVFEWVVDPTTNTVTHRTFIPGGKVSGKINQWRK